MSVSSAASEGDYLETLKALRDTLSKAVDSARPESVAPLSKQLMDVLARIEELTPKNIKDTPLDEFTKRLAKKRSSAG
jgi:hypothetical protein